LHRLVEQLKAVHFFDGFGGGSGVVKDYECLSFGLEIGLCDEVDNFAVLGENLGESFFELFDLYALFKVLYVDTTTMSVGP